MSKGSKVKIEWTITAQVIGMVKANGRVLGLTLSPNNDKWLAIGVETVAPGANASRLAERVLDDHGHQLIGRFRTPSEGIVASEAYGRAWAAGDKDAMIAACACGLIESRPLRFRRRKEPGLS